MAKTTTHADYTATALTLTTAAQPNITSLGTLTTLTVDDITIDGSTVSDGGDLTLDVGGDIILDAGGNEIKLKTNGTEWAQLYNSSSDLAIYSAVQDKDIKLQGNDGGSTITALTLDMSDAGSAYFNNKVGIGTTSPSAPLEINADEERQLELQRITTTTGAVYARLTNDGGNYYIGADATGGDRLAVGGSQYAFTLTAESARPIILATTNTARMTVAAGGNVGIGTTAPTGQRLCLAGHSTSDTMTEANAWFVAEATGGDGIAMGSIASSPYSTWIQSGYLNTLGTSNHYPLALNPHGGKVGVGTTSPDSGLHIAEGGSGSDGGSVLTLSQTGFGTIVNNDDLGSVHFGGKTSGGVGVHNSAKIMVEGDGTWASNDYPTRMSFFTTADGASSATERMRIHNDGTVTVATIPSFAATLSSAYTVTTTDTVIAFNSETFDVGGNHSNGVFTAPVAGLYNFGAHFLLYPWTAGYVNIKWFKNTNVYHTVVQYGSSNDSHTGLSPNALIQMSANDTVSLKISGGGLNSGVQVYGNQAYWWGYLVG
tara:strand:+ start:444 stop:2069 length:1626 start_codon:yes stop_codon:yes gene_type:complete